MKDNINIPMLINTLFIYTPASAVKIIKPISITTSIPTAINGDSTQNQLHAIYPVSFSATNNIVNRPKKPIPLLLELLELLLLELT